MNTRRVKRDHLPTPKTPQNTNSAGGSGRGRGPPLGRRTFIDDLVDRTDSSTRVRHQETPIRRNPVDPGTLASGSTVENTRAAVTPSYIPAEVGTAVTAVTTEPAVTTEEDTAVTTELAIITKEDTAITTKPTVTTKEDTAVTTGPAVTTGLAVTTEEDTAVTTGPIGRGPICHIYGKVVTEEEWMQFHQKFVDQEQNKDEGKKEEKNAGTNEEEKTEEEMSNRHKSDEEEAMVENYHHENHSLPEGTMATLQFSIR